MNDPVNGIGELERRITERLHDHSRRAPDGDGWEGILDRIERRGRARHRRRAATTGLVVVGLVGSLAVLTSGDDTRVSTTPAPPAADTGESPAPGVLPRLVLDVPGFVLTRAANSESTGPGPDLGPLLLYTAPGDGILGVGPVMFARLVPAGAAYGIGEGPAVTTVDIGGRPGRLVDGGGPVLSLGWPREDGSIVHLIAHDFANDGLLAAGRALEGALALGQDPPTSLGGLALARATRPEGSRWDQTEVSYRSGSRVVELRLTTGGPYEHDSLLLDRLASATSWRTASFDGTAANLATYQQSPDVSPGEQARTLIWIAGDGVVAELAAQGLTEAEIEAAAASIREIDEAAWGDLVARFDGRTGGPEEDEGRDPLPAMAEICQLRDRWLATHAAGDPDVEAALVAQLGSVLAKGRAAGLGETGDILVVAQRLLDAMAAGDTAAVSSIPEGGACS